MPSRKPALTPAPQLPSEIELGPVQRQLVLYFVMMIHDNIGKISIIPAVLMGCNNQIIYHDDLHCVCAIMLSYKLPSPQIKIIINFGKQQEFDENCPLWAKLGFPRLVYSALITKVNIKSLINSIFQSCILYNVSHRLYIILTCFVLDPNLMLVRFYYCLHVSIPLIFNPV